MSGERLVEAAGRASGPEALLEAVLQEQRADDALVRVHAAFGEKREEQRLLLLVMNAVGDLLQERDDPVDRVDRDGSFALEIGCDVDENVELPLDRTMFLIEDVQSRHGLLLPVCRHARAVR